MTPANALAAALASPTDESLIAGFHQGDCPDAPDRILRRKQPWLDVFIRGLARRFGLPPCALAEALQVGSLAAWEAIRRYRPPRPGDRRACSFQTFLERKVEDRFRDFVRDRRRAQCRNRWEDLAALGAIEPVPRPGEPAARGVFKRWNEAPEREIDRERERQHLERLIRELEDGDRLFVEVFWAVGSMVATAKELKMSRYKARKRYRRIVRILRRGWFRPMD